MDTELLKTVGQIAGIGGIALGVFLLLFRGLIRKAIFPRLSAQQASRLLTLIAVLVWSVALTGIGAWVWTEQAHNPAARTAADGIRVHQGVGTGGNIQGSQIRITPLPVGPPADGSTPSAGMEVRGGVGAGGNIEDSRIDIAPAVPLPDRSTGPQRQ